MLYHTCKLSQFTETPMKQTMIAAEEAILTEALALLSLVLIFRRIPKCFDTAVLLFFLVLAVNRRSHIHADLFHWTKTIFGSLPRQQSQSPDVNHCVSIIFCLKGDWEPHKNEFLKS